MRTPGRRSSSVLGALVMLGCAAAPTAEHDAVHHLRATLDGRPLDGRWTLLFEPTVGGRPGGDECVLSPYAVPEATSGEQAGSSAASVAWGNAPTWPRRAHERPALLAVGIDLAGASAGEEFAGTIAWDEIPERDGEKSLEFVTSPIHGTVVDADGRPVPSARVACSSGGFRSIARTDDRGTFVLEARLLSRVDDAVLSAFHVDGATLLGAERRWEVGEPVELRLLPIGG